MMHGKPFNLYKRGNTFYARFKLPDGKWSTAKSTRQSSKSKAEAWIIDYLKSGQIITKENVTLEEFSRDFFNWNNSWATDKRVRGLRISQRHCLERTDILNNHLLPALGRYKLTNIDRSVIKELRNKLYNNGYSGSTINKVLSTLRAILEAAEEKSLIKYIPKIDRAAENPKQKGILSLEEVQKLFAAEWNDFKGYIGNLLAASTGLRLGELQALTLRDIHLEKNYIHVRRSWCKRYHQFNQTTKTGKARNIFIPDKVKYELKRLIGLNPYPDNPDSFLFFAEKIDTKPIEAEILNRSLHKALEKIGIDEAMRKTRNITFHSWHWLNSLLINSKIPIQKIQSITGHLTSDMSQHYYHIDEMNDVLQITGNIFSEHVH